MYSLGREEGEFYTSRGAVVLAVHRATFRTVFKVVNMSHVLEKCYVSGKPWSSRLSGDVCG